MPYRNNQDKKRNRLLHNRKSYLKFYYKLTPEEYDNILGNQNGACATCGRSASQFERGLAVDHDHKCCPGDRSCGKCIRGLLCPSCNTALGSVKENIHVLSNLMSYLTK